MYGKFIGEFTHQAEESWSFLEVQPSGDRINTKKGETRFKTEFL